LSSYETQLIRYKDYALILSGLYLQFDQDFKADYVLDKLRVKYRNDEDVLILSAKLLSKIGQGEKALSLLESANVQGSLQFKHTLAVIALQVGELDKGLTYTESLISMSPDVIEYQLLYTRILLKRGQFQSAEKIIANLYTKYPSNMKVRYNYALLQFNIDNLSEAKTLFSSLVKDDPNDGKSWFFLAQIAHDLGDIEEAIRILERQTKNEKYRNRALHKLVQIHYAQYKFEKSLSIIKVLLRSNRLDAEAISMKAKNLIALKQIKEAKHQFNILLGLWNEDARSLLKLSKLQLRVNDLIGAENSLERAYAIEPRALPIIIDIIKSKIRLKKLVEASTILVQAEKDGYKGNIYLIILEGDIENSKNNFNAAFNYYLTALKKDDANIIALVKLSHVSNTKSL
jgi:tetratricopeptide (TPR) repeat protein